MNRVEGAIQLESLGDEEAKAEILLLLAQGNGMGGERHGMSSRDDSDNDVPASDAECSDGGTQSTYEDAAAQDAQYGNAQPGAPHGHCRGGAGSAKRGRDDHHDVPVEGKEDAVAPPKKPKGSSHGPQRSKGYAPALRQPPELTTTSTIPATLPLALQQALLSGSFNNFGMGSLHALTNSLSGLGPSLGSSLNGGLPAGLLGALPPGMPAGMPSSLPSLPNSFSGGLPSPLPNAGLGMPLGNALGHDPRYSFMQRQTQAVAHLAAAKELMHHGANTVQMQQPWRGCGSDMGLDHLAVLSQEYPGFEASISGMLGSPFLSAHGLSNHTLSSNNMSSAGLSGHGRLSAHGMSAHGMSAHGLSAFDISRMFGGQNEPLGGQQAEHLGAALQSEKALDANQSKRKKRSGAWVYKDGAETAAGGGRGAKAPAHTQRKPGPPSSRDKVWDLLEEHEKKLMLTDSMSASEGTRLLLERRAQQLTCAVEQIPEEDDWGIGFKLTECKATSEPLDKPKNCSICMRNGMVFHRHSYYCRRCAQLYRAIHRKKTNLQNEMDNECAVNGEMTAWNTEERRA